MNITVAIVLTCLIGVVGGLLGVIAYIARLIDWNQPPQLDLRRFRWATRNVGTACAALALVPAFLVIPLAKSSGLTRELLGIIFCSTLLVVLFAGVVCVWRACRVKGAVAKSKVPRTN